MMIDHALRARISSAVTEALRPLPAVFAGWEGGSAAFGSVDAYSDLDLEYLVADDASFEFLYASAERAIETVSPIIASHTPPKGQGHWAGIGLSGLRLRWRPAAAVAMVNRRRRSGGLG